MTHPTFHPRFLFFSVSSSLPSQVSNHTTLVQSGQLPLSSTHLPRSSHAKAEPAHEQTDRQTHRQTDQWWLGLRRCEAGWAG